MSSVSVSVTREGAADPIAELSAVVDNLNTVAGQIAWTGADAARGAILDSVTATRGTLSFSGLGASLDVAAFVDDAGLTAEATLQGEPRHVWRFAAGTGPHEVRKRGARGPRGRFVSGLATPLGPYASVNHPGTASIDLVGPAYEAADEAVDTAVTPLADEVIPHG